VLEILPRVAAQTNWLAADKMIAQKIIRFIIGVSAPKQD
jgi:hypothetical protein